MNQNQLLKFFYDSSPWDQSVHTIWPASLFSLRRNLYSYLFPNKMTTKQACDLLNVICQMFPSSFSSVPIDQVSVQNRAAIFERFFLYEKFELGKGKAVFINHCDHAFLALANVEDHLHFHQFYFNKSLMESWKHFSRLEDSLIGHNNHCLFAFSSKFGYLTANPRACGTGLVVRAFLHLPVVLFFEKLWENTKDFADWICIKGLGEDGEFLADFVLIENKYTLGLSEEAIVNLVEKVASFLVTLEASLRSNLINSSIEHALIKDKAMRALGLLKYASLLKTKEALSSLSLIFFGQQMNWIHGERIAFFHLFFFLRQSHLVRYFKTMPSKQDILHERAKIVREQMKDIHIIF